MCEKCRGEALLSFSEKTFFCNRVVPGSVPTGVRSGFSCCAAQERQIATEPFRLRGWGGVTIEDPPEAVPQGRGAGTGHSPLCAS